MTRIRHEGTTTAPTPSEGDDTHTVRPFDVEDKVVLASCALSLLMLVIFSLVDWV